jgi:hypothetical protein
MSKPCDNPKCSVSTGIHEGLTFGHGRLTEHGFWEFPCASCARAWEVKHPEDGACWPYTDTDVAKQTADIQVELAEEEKKWQEFGHFFV